MLVRIANKEDPDQTGYSEAVDLFLHCLSRPFWKSTSVRNFRTFFTLGKNLCCTVYIALK